MGDERIFISYKRKNKHQVFDLVDKIEQELGVKCWIDINGIESMTQFASIICNAIDHCDVVLFMHSSEHLDIDYDTDWTIRELNYAHITNKHVALIKLDDAPLKNIFLMLYGVLNYTDARNGDQWHNLMNHLRVWLSGDININNCMMQSFKVDDVNFKMIYVEGGTFSMGATSNQDDDNCDFNIKPTHEVRLDDYYIGETQVTQALWNSLMDRNPSQLKGDNLPVEMVTFNDVQDFLVRLNDHTGQTFRLPTEAEWEYAARGGRMSKGYKYSGGNNLDVVAWYVENSESKTHNVKSKKANELGIYDMSGNVWEWCSDWYGVYYNGLQTNPQGPETGLSKVFRGGGKDSKPLRCCVYSRNDDSPLQCHYDLGFRLVLDTKKTSGNNGDTLVLEREKKSI